MNDQVHRKLPPDRPSDALVSGSNKKKKNESPSQEIEDHNLPDAVVPPEAVSMEQEVTPMETKHSTISYKASLLGFNGIAHGGECMEEEDLLSDTINREWELPEATAEVQEMMKLHPVVPITAEEYSEWCRPWNAALILTVLGKRYNVYTLKAHLSRLWNTLDFDLVDIPNNYFVVRFLQKEGWGQMYQKVLYEGPWVVQQHTVLIQKWSPGFDPFNNPLGKVATWVRIPNIPMQCYNREFLTRLGNCIGRTLKIDMLSPSNQSAMAARIERGKYARICVELDLQKKLISKVIAAHSVYHVEYEGLTLICFACGRYGHRKEACQWTYTENNTTGKEESAKEKVVVKSPMEKPNPSADEHFGAWMIAGRSQRARASRRGNLPPHASTESANVRRVNQGARKEQHLSRFTVLAGLEDDGELVEQTTTVPGSTHNAPTDQAASGGERAASVRGETQARHIEAAGGQIWQRKGMTGPREERSSAHVDLLPGPKRLGHQVKPKTLDMGLNAVGRGNHGGRRDNIVVGGNLAQMQSNPIKIGTHGGRQQNKNILMLEGPVAKDSQSDNSLVKGKCEQNPMSSNPNDTRLAPINMPLDEDIGDDFMTVNDGEFGQTALEQQAQRGENSSGM